MDDVLRMQISNAHGNRGDVLLRLVFVEAFATSQVVSELAAMEVLHDKVESLLILEALNHFNDEGVLSVFENFLFLDNFFERAIFQHKVFPDHL